jgi:hypothetical protein
MNTDADDILHELTTRQHLTPGRPLKDIVAETVATTGVCAAASERALGWLNMSEDTPIGRLRRSELIQLARSMHRFWTELRVPENGLPDGRAAGRAAPAPRSE